MVELSAHKVEPKPENRGTSEEFPTEPVALIAMDRLQRARGVVRATITSTLHSLDELFRAAPPPIGHPNDPGLSRRKKKSLKELDKQISEALRDEEFEPEMTATLEYNERLCNITSRARDSDYSDPVQSRVYYFRSRRHSDWK